MIEVDKRVRELEKELKGIKIKSIQHIESNEFGKAVNEIMKADRTLEKIRYINELKAAGLLVDKNADGTAFVRGAEYYASKTKRCAISYKDLNHADETP